MHAFKKRIAPIFLSFPFFSPCYGQSIDGWSNWLEDNPSPGALCAIKKAYQLTELPFTPLDSIRANPYKKYKKGVKSKGMIYSSVKEIDTFVGVDVSVHTFMTALYNPRSVIYSLNASLPPFHGVNCGAYYGVVCNTFISYALGLKVPKSTYDLPHAENMILVEDQSSQGVRLADIVSKKGHVMLVTRIGRENGGNKAVELEISEAVRTGCRRVLITGKELDEYIAKGLWTLYRYKDLEKNTYVPLTDFVAVSDEELTPFHYNDAICTNRGDKACFISGDTVVLNIQEGYKTVEIYKDSAFYKKIKLRRNTDIELDNLPYGDYQARVTKKEEKSDFTHWKVIDVHVNLDVNKKEVSFYSANSVPVYLEFCNIVGARPTEGVFEFSEDDLLHGKIDVSPFQMTKSQQKKGMYVKVHFECEYGRVINKPIKWDGEK